MKKDSDNGLEKSSAALTIQKWYRGYRSRLSTQKLYKRMTQRRKIIEQLVVTQQKYIHDLSIMISDFQMYLFNSKILTSSQVHTLFSNIDAIRKLNQHFFVLLHNSFKDFWHYKIVFEDVKKQVSFFKIYFEYLNNFTASMALMKELKENNGRFKTFLINVKKNASYGGLDLEDFLIKPVQRLPKYVLLLKLLLKKTQPDHPDFVHIKKSLEGFQEVNTSNNQKLNKLINNFKLSQLQKQARLPFHIAQPGTQFIMEENVTLLTSSNQVQDAVMYLLNNRVILTKRTKSQLKFLETVSFRYGVSIMQNEQELYENCFTLQSIDGDSVTLLFQTEQQMQKIMKLIKSQIKQTEKKTYQKYATLQNTNQISQSFINKMCRYDLMPEVTLLGTEERTDKMLKYTTYIVEVKVKNIRQKIFLRYSELLDLQILISLEFPQLEIKQSLYKTTWFLNHKPKTIEERKMSIQKFLTEVLSKPEIIQSGAVVLSKLGLPEDLYELPEKLKTSESFLKKSSIICQNKVPKSERETKDRQGGSVSVNTLNTKTRNTYRLSIFMEWQEQQKNLPRKFSLHQNNTKQSVRSSVARNKLNVEEILFANQLDLGHYVRYSQNIPSISRNKLQLQVYIPWLSTNSILSKKKIEIMENQRVAALINKLAKEIQLNYHKDFRLFLEKQHSQRVLDDDQIIQKVERELVTGKYSLVLKKMIYIDRQAEEKQIKSNRLRLKIIASQVIYQVKKGKYRLNYSKFLTLSVLMGVVQSEGRKDEEEKGIGQGGDEAEGTQSISVIKRARSENEFRASSTLNKSKKPNIKQLALRTRSLLTNSYASFFQNDKVWIKDYQECYKTLTQKLAKIVKENSYLLNSQYYTQDEEMIFTSISQLSYLSIIEQVKSDQLFGSMGYVVQISEKFQEALMKCFQMNNNNHISRTSQHTSRTFQQRNPIIDPQTLQNRNVWLIVKWSSIYLYSINLANKLYEITYDEIGNVVCYPSSVFVQFRDRLESKIYPGKMGQSKESVVSKQEMIYDNELGDDEDNNYHQNDQQNQSRTAPQINPFLFPNSIKFKTTNSYVIRQLICYYKNYNMLSRKIEQDEQYTSSLIEMINENSRVLNQVENSKYGDGERENFSNSEKISNYSEIHQRIGNYSEVNQRILAKERSDVGFTVSSVLRIKKSQ